MVVATPDLLVMITGRRLSRHCQPRHCLSPGSGSGWLEAASSPRALAGHHQASPLPLSLSLSLSLSLWHTHDLTLVTAWLSYLLPTPILNP